MPSLNRVQIIGYLGKDPECHTTANGKTVTTFNIAIHHRWRSSDGEMKEGTEWARVETWGRLAEICHNYLSKGRLVYVEGRLHTDHYEQNGETRYSTKVVANQMQMLDPRPEEGPDPTQEEELEEPVIE